MTSLMLLFDFRSLNPPMMTEKMMIEAISKKIIKLLSCEVTGAYSPKPTVVAVVVM